jgi:hypothetical protein
MQVGGQRLALNAPLGHCQAPATQIASTPTSVPQLETQAKNPPSAPEGGQLVPASAPPSRQVVTPLAGSQVQPLGRGKRHTGGSQVWVAPTSDGQVQAPFRQTGATAVVPSQP